MRGNQEFFLSLKLDMIFLFLLGSAFCGNQLHLAYLGENSRSISWTSMTSKDSMTLAYKNMKLEKPIFVNSSVTTWKEPQVENEYRYIHTVVLDRLMFNEQYEYWLTQGEGISKLSKFNGKKSGISADFVVLLSEIWDFLGFGLRDFLGENPGNWDSKTSILVSKIQFKTQHITFST